MIDLKKELLLLEKQFLLFKAKNEKLHKYFLLLYFSPPLLLIVILFFFNKQSFENIYIKVSIFFTIVLGVLLHFFFRRLFEGEKLKNRDFILSKLESLKSSFKNEVIFEKKLSDTIKEIFNENNLQLSFLTIKNEIFWKIIFTEYKIDIEN